MATSGIQALNGTWEYVDGEHFDEYMKEIGVGLTTRLAAKSIKPRLIISENGGKWTVRSESSVKTTSYDFTPGVEFAETTADGRDVKSTIKFEVIRYVDDKGQQMIDMECGSVKARRWYKRA
ncbi:unnamed protein product [Rotaria magnacalcarata]